MFTPRELGISLLTAAVATGDRDSVEYLLDSGRFDTVPTLPRYSSLLHLAWDREVRDLLIANGVKDKEDVYLRNSDAYSHSEKVFFAYDLISGRYIGAFPPP